MGWRVLVAALVGCSLAATAVAIAADAEQASPLKRIIGTKGANVLRGTGAADFIDGRAGNDVLYGLGGNDRLVGGAGDDRILCGRGRDKVFADLRDNASRDCEDVRGVVMPPKPADVPGPLLGLWNRYIDNTAVIDANHVANHVGVWSVNFGRDGVVVVYEPVGAHVPGVRDTIYGTFSATAGGDLIFDAGTGCPTKGSYRWEIADAVLRIQDISDACAIRAAVIFGDWVR